MPMRILFVFNRLSGIVATDGELGTVFAVDTRPYNTVSIQVPGQKCEVCYGKDSRLDGQGLQMVGTVFLVVISIPLLVCWRVDTAARGGGDRWPAS